MSYLAIFCFLKKDDGVLFYTARYSTHDSTFPLPMRHWVSTIFGAQWMNEPRNSVAPCDIFWPNAATDGKICGYNPVCANTHHQNNRIPTSRRCTLVGSVLGLIYFTLYMSLRLLLNLHAHAFAFLIRSACKCRSIAFAFLILFFFVPATRPLTRYFKTGCSESNQTWQSGRSPWGLATEYFWWWSELINLIN